MSEFILIWSTGAILTICIYAIPMAREISKNVYNNKLLGVSTLGVIMVLLLLWPIFAVQCAIIFNRESKSK